MILRGSSSGMTGHGDTSFRACQGFGNVNDVNAMIDTALKLAYAHQAKAIPIDGFDSASKGERLRWSTLSRSCLRISNGERCQGGSSYRVWHWRQRLLLAWAHPPLRQLPLRAGA